MYLFLQVVIEQKDTNSETSQTFSSVSAQAEASAEASYGGLFYSGSASGGFNRSHGNSSLAKEGSDLKIAFKVRKVLIQRPWLEPNLFRYPTIGIKGLNDSSWSSGELNSKTNKGSFPLLPTVMVVAKDVVISARSFSDAASSSFSKMKSHASFKVCAYAVHRILIAYYVSMFCGLVSAYVTTALGRSA